MLAPFFLAESFVSCFVWENLSLLTYNCQKMTKNPGVGLKWWEIFKRIHIFQKIWKVRYVLRLSLVLDNQMLPKSNVAKIQTVYHLKIIQIFMNTKKYWNFQAELIFMIFNSLFKTYPRVQACLIRKNNQKKRDSPQYSWDNIFFLPEIVSFSMLSWRPNYSVLKSEFRHDKMVSCYQHSLKILRL